MRIALWSLYAFFWIGGVLTGGVAPHAPWAAPLFLVLAGVLAFRKELAVPALLGFTAELIGVHTGYPFGGYTYTQTLGPTIAGVPIVIGAAWLILIDLCSILRPAARFSLWLAAQAALITATDLVIDPVAAGPLHYWIWTRSGPYYGIPLSNYLGWFVVSLIIFTFVRPKSNHQPYAGITVLAFFSILAARNGLWIPAVIGITLTLALATLSHRLSGKPFQTIPSSE